MAASRPSSRPSSRRSSTRAPLILATVGVLGYGIVALVNVVLSRIMGSALFGDYHVALSVLSMMAAVVLVGSDMAATRFIPHLHRTGDHGRLGDFFAWNLRWLMRSFGLGLVVALAVLGFAILFDSLGVRSIDDYHLAFFVIWLAPAAAAAQLLGSYFVSLGHSVVGAVSRTFAIDTLMLVFVLLAVLVIGLPSEGNLGIRNGAVILAIWALSYLCLIVGQLLLMRLHEPAIYALLKDAARAPAADADRTWSKTSRTMLITAINVIVVWHIDIVIVELLAPDENATGYYAALLIIVRVLYLVPHYVLYTLRSKIGYAFDKPEEYPALQHALHGVNLVIVVGSSIAFAGVMLFHGPILDLFGPGFRSAGPALMIMSTGVFLAVILQPARVVVMMSGGEKIGSRITGFGAMAIVGFGAAATYFWSFTGMAAVTGIVMVAQNIAFYAVARRRLEGIRPLSLL